MIYKRILNSDGFKIYWPLLACWLFAIVLLALVLPIWPGTKKEFVFVCVGTVALLSSLWIVVFRYNKVKNKSVGGRAKTLLIILTVLCLFGVVCGVLAFFQ